MTIELDRREDPIAGTVSSPRETLPFSGWTGLLAALESALGLAEPPQVGSEPWA